MVMPAEATPVVFRKWRDNGQIIALFPESPADTNGRFCDSYMHVGQHGGADYYGVVQYTLPASQDEAAALASELRRIGYQLKVMRRASRRQHEQRQQMAWRIATA